jgi:hypothetical protein
MRTVTIRKEVNEIIEFGRLQCWYYLWVTVDMTSDGMMYIPSFMKTGLKVQVILRLLPQQFDRIWFWYSVMRSIYEVRH